MNIPACDKWGNPKNLHAFKKVYRRRPTPNFKTWLRFDRQRTREEKLRGVNPEFAHLFV